MFGQSCGVCRQLFYLLAGHGCGLHPAFPAPSSNFEGDASSKTRAQRAAGMMRCALKKTVATFSAVMPRFTRGIRYSRDGRA